MTHGSSGAYTSLKEALAYDNDLHDKKLDPIVKRVEIIESDLTAIAIEGLETLYGSLYSLYQFLQLQGVDKHDLRSWMLYRDKKLSAVFLFFIESTYLRVVTEMMTVTESDLSCFTQYIFTKYKKIHSISFNACALPCTLPAYPHQIFHCSENYIIDLPINSEQYLCSLGRATRKTIKSSINKFRRDFPDYVLQRSEGRELSAADQSAMLRKLQQFKKTNMEERGRAVAFNDVENQRLLALIADRGIFTQVMINGEMRAGSIACRVGSNIVMLISAADPLLTSYRCGFLVCYWTIAECAQHGIEQCHLLWGQYQYKTQLGAQPHNLMRAIFYRSYLVMFLSPFKFMSMFSRNISLQGRNWLICHFQRSPHRWIQQLLQSLRSLRTHWY